MAVFVNEVGKQYQADAPLAKSHSQLPFVNPVMEEVLTGSPAMTEADAMTIVQYAADNNLTVAELKQQAAEVNKE